MHFSYIISSIGALAFGQLSTAHPTSRTTIAPPTNTITNIHKSPPLSTTPQPHVANLKARVTLKNTLHHANHPISLPPTTLIHTYTTNYTQHAYILPSASTCSDLCQIESQKNCIMATYTNSTELCLLHLNRDDITGGPKSTQCPLGFPSSGYEKVEDWAADGAGVEDEDGDEKEAVWMSGPCLDPGDGSVGSVFGDGLEELEEALGSLDTRY